MIKLVIFDFDDTITDNRYLDYASFKTTFNKFNIKNELSLKKLISLRQKSYTAKNILKVIKNSTEKKFSSKNFLNDRKNFLLSYESNNYLKVKKDTTYLMEYLDSKNISILLCSVRHDKNIIKKFLKENNIEDYFKNIFCSSDLKLTIENDTSSNRILIKSSLLKKILIKNKIKFYEIVYVGNSFEDKVAALTHKINFIKFDNDYLPLENNKYEYSANSMKDVNKILGKMLKNG